MEKHERMNYKVTNGEVCVGALHIFSLSTAASLLIGDTKKVYLFTTFEGPPEELIVGVTLAPVRPLAR